MPIDYKKYCKDWKLRSHFIRHYRAKNKCEFCGIENHKVVIRGKWYGVKCYQDEDGNIYDEKTSEKIGDDYLGEVHPTNALIKIVLTVAHLDHDLSNNSFFNLKALCQKCHNNYDKSHRKRNKGTLNLFDR